MKLSYNDDPPVSTQRQQRRENLKSLLNPRHIAFIGGRQMDRCIEMCRNAGYRGKIWTVNPRYESLGGVACVPTINDLPEPPDASFIALAREHSIEVVAGLAKLGARGAVVHAAGFGELGPKYRHLEQQLDNAADAMAVIGPNAMGVINNFDGVAIWPDNNAVESVTGPGIALISQSGAILFGVTNIERSYPMGYALSVGNQSVIDSADVIATVLDDARVQCIGLYLEGLNDGVALDRAFNQACQQNVPVVLLRGGGTPQAAERSLSHTGNLAVPNDFWQALIDRHALIEVRSPKQLVETTKLLAVAGVPKGPRVFLTTYSGAACTLVAEQAPERGLQLPPVTQANHDRVVETLPADITISNPFDLNLPWQSKNTVRLTDSGSIATCLLDVSRDQADTIGFLLDIPPHGSGDESWVPTVDAMIKVAQRSGLPCVVASIMPEGLAPHHRQHLIDHGVAPLQGMTECLDALGHAASYQKSHSTLHATHEKLRTLLRTPSFSSLLVLDEMQSKRRLARAGVPVPTGWSGPISEATAAAERIGFPVVLKVLSNAVAHKDRFGGVQLNLTNVAEVGTAISNLKHNLANNAPGFDLTEVLVESFVSEAVCELIIGVKRHTELGAALLIGTGGVAVETKRNYALALLPATRRALSIAFSRLGLSLSTTASSNVLSAMETVAEFAMTHIDELAELDINPLIVGANDSVIAVDALMVIGDDKHDE